MPFHIRSFLTQPLAFWFLITLLVLNSGPAYAEWVAVEKTDDGMTIYFDPDSIRRKEDLVKMWVLYDYKTVQTVEGVSYLTLKTQSEYDCTEKRTRMLEFTYFSGQMGSGKVAFSDSVEGKWLPVSPDSIGEAVWKFACGKE